MEPMRKSTVALFTFFLMACALGGAALFFWPKESLLLERVMLPEDTMDEAGNEDMDMEGDEIFSPENEKERPQTEVFLDISQADCANECETFHAAGEKLRYCRSYCGLSEEGSALPVTGGNCGSEKGIERDYCFKNEAVAEKNLSRCEAITDVNIQKSCQARVTEDLLP